VIAPAALVLALVLDAANPYVYEVPRGGPSLESQRRPLFFAAPFTVREGRVVQGAERASDRLLRPGITRVAVVASWCPACHHLLRRLSAQRPQTTVILFLGDESERRGGGGGGPLTDAASLERYRLELHLLGSGSDLARRVTKYPTTFLCSRTRCTPEDVGRKR
jgi:hypothetical protein